MSDWPRLGDLVSPKLDSVKSLDAAMVEFNGRKGVVIEIDNVYDYDYPILVLFLDGMQLWYRIDELVPVT